MGSGVAFESYSIRRKILLEFGTMLHSLSREGKQMKWKNFGEDFYMTIILFSLLILVLNLLQLWLQHVSL